MKTKRLAAPLKRKIHVNGMEWTYTWARGEQRRRFVGFSSEVTTLGKVCILNPSRTKKWVVPYDGKQHRREDARGDDRVSVQLTPSWVKAFIEENLLEEA